MVEQSKNESSVTQTLAEISLDKSETKEKKPNTAITKLQKEDEMDSSDLGEPIFEEYFPILSESLVNFKEITNFDNYVVRRDEGLKANEEKPDSVKMSDNLKEFSLKEVCGPLMDQVSDEIQKTVTEWDELKSMMGGFVAAHSLIVLWLVT